MRCAGFIGFTLLVAATICVLLSPSTVKAGTADFENLSLAPESYWYGTDATYNNGSGDYNFFQSGGTTFNNYHEYYFEPAFGYDIHYWESWGYSNKSDIGSLGFPGQFTAMGSGVSGHNGAGDSANYGLAFVGFFYTVPTVTFDTPGPVIGASFTNNAYAYGSMLTGDSFAKKFGGVSGNDADWFLLTISGKDTSGAVTGTVDFYLADFRFANNSLDYIIHDWTFVDLTSLGENVKSLEFGLTSSDAGDFGMNTPGYFAMDNLTVVPEPSAIVLLLGAVITGAVWRCGRRLRPLGAIVASLRH